MVELLGSAVGRAVVMILCIFLMAGYYIDPQYPSSFMMYSSERCDSVRCYCSSQRARADTRHMLHCVLIGSMAP